MTGISKEFRKAKIDGYEMNSTGMKGSKDPESLVEKFKSINANQFRQLDTIDHLPMQSMTVYYCPAQPA